MTMLSSIRILLFIVAHFDYEVREMNVKTVFLKENIDESIYMTQPDGFIQKVKEHKVCKLKRFIYGLKKESRS